MAVSEQRVRVAECDGCGAKRYGEGNAKIPGVHGKVTVIGEGGDEQTVEYFSCRTDAGHVGKSTVAAVQRAPRSGNGLAGQPHQASYGG